MARKAGSRKQMEGSRKGGEKDVRPEIGRVAADDEVGRARNTAVKLRGDELSQIKICRRNTCRGKLARRNS